MGQIDFYKKNKYTKTYRATGAVAEPCTCNPL